jgi:hypothetical protein
MSPRPAWAIAFVGFVAALALVASSEPRPAGAQPKPPEIKPAPQAPTLTTPANLGGKPGETVEVVLTGTNLADPVAVVLGFPGKATILAEDTPGKGRGKGKGKESAGLRVKVDVPDDCPAGMHTMRVVTRQGVSNFRPFVVDDLPVVAESDSNRTKDAAQAVPVPAVVTGRTDAEASDFFKVKVSPGQTLTFEVLARRLGSPLDPIVVLHDAKTKRELIDLYADDTPGLQADCRLTHTFKEAGEVLVEVRDTTYRGGPDFFYRLRVGEFPGATTAFPVAVQRGKTTKVGFAGPGTADLKPVEVKAPTDEAVAAVSVAPKRAGGVAGWPVPVRLSDVPETTEQEPNNDPSKANTLPVPGGVSAKFADKGDVDHFKVACKKGTKYAAAATTFEINSPAEVLIRVLDPKGAEVARSNPAQPAARAEFTPAADGDYVIACEQLNYLSGPNEIYHLSVQPVAPDFTIVLALDRCEAPPGGGTAVMATVTRLNGFAGPVELSLASDGPVSGKTTLPAGQTIAFIPLLVKDGADPGAVPFQVRGTAKIDGKEVVRVGTLTDAVKANLGGMPNPPPELLSGCVAAVVEKPAFALTLTADPEAVEKGKAGKVVIDATRGDGGDGEIAVAALYAPPNVTPAAKPIPKGQTKGELGLTFAPAAAAGPNPVVVRATTKVGGKDYAVTPPPVVVTVTEPKKDEKKKEDKKDGKKG